MTRRGAIEWTEYRSQPDMADRVNGVRRAGQIWSEAPGPGQLWVRPNDSARAVIVVHCAASHGGKPYSIADGSE